MALVSKGTKRVGSVLKFNEKQGCTVMVTLDMIGNHVLLPLSVYTCNFDKTYIIKCRSVTKGTDLSTKTHRITVHCLKIYFKYVSSYYPMQKIGLVFDSAPTHLHKELKYNGCNY